METQTPTLAQTPTTGQEPAIATTPPDCRSELLWTALSARWLGRCRENNAMERETS